jgi:hypothetical protein
VFAKLKAVLRKIAAYTLNGAAYSIKSLCKTIAAVLTKSLGLNAHIQDMVNLNEKGSKCLIFWTAQVQNSSTETSFRGFAIKEPTFRQIEGLTC